MAAKPDFFTSEASRAYDERNRALVPISDNMHFLIRLIVRDLPRSHVLCIGVGTGAEILSLSKEFPEWTFVGVDPSAHMLDVCRQRLQDAGVLDRCTLIHGYVYDVPLGEQFDVALSILVAHFVKREERLSYFKAMCDRLRPNGYLINTEISFDLDSEEFPSMLNCWEGVQKLMGVPPEKISPMLRDALFILPPAETENLLRQSGIHLPLRFFQAFMICGWAGKKSSV